MKRVVVLWAAVVAACGAQKAEPPAVSEAPPQLAAPCDAELAAFEAEVFRPILSVQCAACHTSEGAARDTRLEISAGAASDQIVSTWRSAGALALLELDGTPELLLRASGSHPLGHSGGALVPVGSAEYLVLARFAEDVADPSCNVRAPQVCAEPPYGPRMLRRLSVAEYEATLSALFGGASSAVALAIDPSVGGFDNDARTQRVSALLADQLRLNAEEIGAAVAENLGSVLPCTPSPTEPSTCRDHFIQTLGAKVFRRPLAQDEVERYGRLFEVTAEGTFAEGVRWVVTAMLQSPHFLYRSELGVESGGVYRLTDHEIATALSYFLTGEPPDDTLRLAAQLGLLLNADERELQARRLLATNAGRQNIARFFTEWLDLDRVRTVPKDADTYPELTPPLREAMAQETERFLIHTAATGRLPELFTSSDSYLSPELEAHYGEVAEGAPDAAGFRRSHVPGQRFGILTQGSLLTVHARASDASPIHRGKVVRTRLLCQTLPPPPPGMFIEPPPVDPNLTTRERYAAHSTVEPCKSCHRLMDPIGFGLGGFDGIGRQRSQEAGRPVDTHGELLATPRSDGAFDDLEGLATRLATSPDVAECFSRTWLRWGFGVEAEGGLGCALEEAHRQFEADDLKIEALVIALARSEHLTTRTSTAP